MFGYGDKNERVERLVNFCLSNLSNSLVITKTMFQQNKSNRMSAWQSPDATSTTTQTTTTRWPDLWPTDWSRAHLHGRRGAGS